MHVSAVKITQVLHYQGNKLPGQLIIWVRNAAALIVVNALQRYDTIR